MESNRFDAIVVGAGLSGLTAAAFFARQKLRVALATTGPGSFVLGSGCLKTRDIAEAGAAPALHDAIGFFCEMARLAGLQLDGDIGRSRPLPTILGGFERVSFAPRLQWNSEPRENVATVVAGVRGLSSFDENFMTERLNGQARTMGIECRYSARQISLQEDLGTPVTTLRIAKRLDCDTGFRVEVLRALRDAARGFQRILVPSMLGLHASEPQIAEFEQELGCELGELPTLPPSMAGLRMFNRLWNYLHSIGVEQYLGYPVEKIETCDGLCTAVEVASPGHALILHGEMVVLAGGRGSTGLLAGSHAALDAQMRPIGTDGSPIAINLFAVGPGRKSDGNSNDVDDILAGYCAAQYAMAARGVDAC